MAWKVTAPYKVRIETGESAPFVKVKIYHPGEEDLNVVLDGLVDSGASISLLPSELPRRLLLLPVREINIVDVHRGRRPSRMYYPSLKFEDWDREFEAVEFGIWGFDFALLGRKLLNELHIVLHGPERRMMISD